MTVNFTDVARFVTPFAPILGTALGGPLGGVAGSLIASVFGGSPANPSDLLARIQQDADAAVKLKQIELDHEETLKKLTLQAQEDSDKDTQDARKMNDARDDWIRMILASLLIATTIISIRFALTSTDANDEHMLYMVIMYLILEITQIYKYYFGGNVPAFGALSGMNGNGK